MGGKDKQAEQQQRDLSAAQMQMQKDLLTTYKEQEASRKELQQPLVDYAKAMASGDYSSMLTVAAVPLSNLATSAAQTRESIFDSVPRGPARDFALAQLERDKGNQSAQFMNSSFLQALNTLGGLGTESGQLGLQTLGGSISSGNSAAATNKTLMDQATARKAATLGALGQLGGMAGSVLI